MGILLIKFPLEQKLAVTLPIQMCYRYEQPMQCEDKSIRNMAESIAKTGGGPVYLELAQ
jgi:hypothetical protein